MPKHVTEFLLKYHAFGEIRTALLSMILSADSNGHRRLRPVSGSLTRNRNSASLKPVANTAQLSNASSAHTSRNVLMILNVPLGQTALTCGVPLVACVALARGDAHAEQRQDALESGSVEKLLFHHKRGSHPHAIPSSVCQQSFWPFLRRHRQKFSWLSWPCQPSFFPGRTWPEVTSWLEHGSAILDPQTLVPCFPSSIDRGVNVCRRRRPHDPQGTCKSRQVTRLWVLQPPSFFLLAIAARRSHHVWLKLTACSDQPLALFITRHHHYCNHAPPSCIIGHMACV